MDRTTMTIDMRARRMWALVAAGWLAQYLPRTVSFAVGRIVARLFVVVEFRMSSRDRWRRAPLHEQIG